MRLDSFWVVTDAGAESELGDICFETTVEGLVRQVLGGLTTAEHPMLFTEREEAEAEATRRLVLARVGAALAEAAPGADIHSVAQVALLGTDGDVLIEADLASLRGVPPAPLR